MSQSECPELRHLADQAEISEDEPLEEFKLLLDEEGIEYGFQRPWYLDEEEPLGPYRAESLEVYLPNETVEVFAVLEEPSGEVYEFRMNQ